MARNADALNSNPDLVANIDDGSDGHWIKLSATADGSFAIENGRTGVTKAYGRAPKAGTR